MAEEGTGRTSGDLTLPSVTLLLAGIGLVMLYSASSIMAEVRYQDGMYFFKRQVVFIRSRAHPPLVREERSLQPLSPSRLCDPRVERPQPLPGAVIGLVIETRCNYFASLAFPQKVEAGLRVAHLGRSSVRYEVGLFAQGAPETAAAGHFIHVYVDRQTRRPVDLPDALRAALKPLIATA